MGLDTTLLDENIHRISNLAHNCQIHRIKYWKTLIFRPSLIDSEKSKNKQHQNLATLS